MVADTTYVPTQVRFVYLAVVVDAFSRRVVGWSLASYLRAELVVEALEMTIQQRHPDGVIHHSDHGSQYTSIAFGERFREAGSHTGITTVLDSADIERYTVRRNGGTPQVPVFSMLPVCFGGLMVFFKTT